MHQFIFRFHKHILIFTLICTLGAGVLISQLKLDLDLFSLLPEDHPGLKTFFEITEQIGFQSLLIAVITFPKETDQADKENFVQRLAEKYAQTPLILKTRYKTESLNTNQIFEHFAPYALLFIDQKDFKRLGAKLTDDQIKNQIRENKKILTTPFGVIGKNFIQNDPLNLAEILTAGKNYSPDLQTDSQKMRDSKGYYRSQDSNTYFLFIRPQSPPQNLAFSKKLMKSVTLLSDQVINESRTPGQNFKEISVSFTGGYPIAVNDEAVTRYDVQLTLLTSFAGIMIIFGIWLKTPKILIFIGLSLIISLLWTFAFALPAFGHLNFLTLIFACVLIGLGVDFAIHVVNRYFDQQAIGLTQVQRLEYTYKTAGSGILIGGFTTAVAFYSIGLSDFRGFRELGILTGTGLLFSILTMTVVLPSLLTLFYKPGILNKPTILNKKDGKTKSIRMAGLGLVGILGWIEKYPKIILFGSGLLLLWFGLLAKQVGFDDNLRNFRPNQNKTFQLQDKVSSWLGGSTSSFILVTAPQTEKDALELDHKIYTALNKLVISGKVAHLKGLGKYLKTPAQQQKTLSFITENQSLFDAERICLSFFREMNLNGFRVSEQQQLYLANLKKAIRPDRIILPSDLKATEFTKLLNQFFLQKDNRFRTITYISPPQDLWESSATSAFREMLVSRLEAAGISNTQYQLSGAGLLTNELKTLIIKNMTQALWVAGLVISIMLFLYYRDLKLMALAMSPLLAGLIILGGVLALLKIDFNFFNLMVLPMVVGIGIDDGVHFTNTFNQQIHHEKDNYNMPEELSRTGRALVLTSLTSLVGFGSIILSHYPGLRSMGYVALAGIGGCLYASIIILPALFAIIKKHPAQFRPRF